MKFELTIETCSDDRNLVRMLAQVMSRVLDADLSPDIRYPVIDENGNCVGHYEVETDPDE